MHDWKLDEIIDERPGDITVTFYCKADHACDETAAFHLRASGDYGVEANFAS